MPTLHFISPPPLSHGFRSPDRPVHSQSLYRLRYPVHGTCKGECNYKNIKFTDRKFNIFHNSVLGTNSKFTTHTNSFKLYVSVFCEIK